MSVIKANGAGEQSTGFYNNVATQSLRFDDGSSSYLAFTPSSASSSTDRRKVTHSFWIKRAGLGSQVSLYSANRAGGGDYYNIAFNASDEIQIYLDVDSGGYGYKTSAVFRDTTSWFNVVLIIDTTQGTDTNRVKLYVNGALQTISTVYSGGHVAQNFSTYVMDGNEDEIGRFAFNDSAYFDGYMSEVILTIGQDNTISEFGETKEGVWIAKNYSGSYGANGVRLQFKETGDGQTTASSSTIGADTSGNDNHWKDNNLDTYDSNMPDSPENNFSTLLGDLAEGGNEYQSYVSGGTYAEGNLKLTGTSDWSNGKNNFLVDSGKWYVEYRVTALHATTHNRFGVYARPARTYDEYFWLPNGSAQIDAADASSKVGTYTTNDIIQVALDLENNNIFFGKNNTWQNSATASEIVAGTSTNAFASGSQVPTGDGHSYGFYNNPHSSSAGIYNFGQDSSFAGTTSAQGNSDSQGFGDFYYTPPAGFLSMCTSNLADSAIGTNSDIKPRDVFEVLLYTGDASSTRAITGVGFKPDWVWFSQRNNTSSKLLFDSSRGVNKALFSNTNGSETDQDQYGYLSVFGDDGFTLQAGSTNNNYLNENNINIVAWNWKVNGGTTSSNSDGSGTSTVQVNQTAGISIVLYTGNATGAGAEQTIGHGLGAVPDVILFKARDYDSQNWYMHHTGLVDGVGTHIELDTNAGEHADGDYMNGVAPTSSVFSLGYNFTTNKNGNAYVAYCFKSISGYSKFGFYEGTSNNSGVYVHLGFRPRWVMIKNTDDTDNWYISDEVRDTADAPGNPMTETLNANNNSAEYTTGSNKIDFLSNGFKARDSASGDTNINNEIYIYWAFAEAPFKFANAK